MGLLPFDTVSSSLYLVKAMVPPAIRLRVGFQETNFHKNADPYDITKTIPLDGLVYRDIPVHPVVSSFVTRSLILSAAAHAIELLLARALYIFLNSGTLNTSFETVT